MKGFAAAVVLGLLLPGCIGPERPERETLSDDFVAAGESIVLKAGSLKVPSGTRYELDGGELRLHDDPDVTVNGVIDVEGTFVARRATLANVYRLTAHPGSTLVLEDVDLSGAPVGAILQIHSNDARVTASRLRTRFIEVKAAAEVSGNTILADAELPAVWWHDSAVRLTDNVVSGAGPGIVVERGSGEVLRNTVEAGRTGLTPAIAVRRGTANVAENVVTGAIGIAFEDAGGEVSGNTIRNTSAAGIALSRATARVASNTVEDPGRAGIFLRNCTAEVVVTGNAVRGAVNSTAVELTSSGAGIVVDGGAPVVESNDVTGNDVGIAVLAGAPTIHNNNIESNSRFGLVLGQVGTDKVDATLNWWGAPSGPAPSVPDSRVPSTPSVAQRVDARAAYAPWLVTRRA